MITILNMNSLKSSLTEIFRAVFLFVQKSLIIYEREEQEGGLYVRKRSREILQMIARQKKDFRIQDLAETFHVSERTIRNDLNDINDYLRQQNLTEIELGSKGRLVICEDIEDAADLEEEQDLYTYRLSKEERVTLAAAILIDAKDHITLSEIAKMLYVSRATIINDLDGVKELLGEGNLEVISHSNKGLRLEGAEGDKRLFLLKLMAVGSNGIKEDAIVRSFFKGLNMEIRMSEDDRRKLQKIMNEQEHVYGRFLTDASFDYLMQYLMLSIQRIQQGNLMMEPVAGNKSKYKMAEDILKYVCLYWNLPEGQGEIDFLCGVLDSMSYVRRKRREQKIIGLQLVTRKFIEKISEDLHTDLTRDFDFHENLTDHLESIIMKSFNVAQRDDFLKGYVEKNLNVLKVVKQHLEILETFMDRDISEIEIDYIVIHICAALERRKKKEVDFRVLIVCSGGIGTSQLLLAKLKNRFDFHVVDVVSAHLLNKRSTAEVDLVISTIPLKEYEGEYILVTPVLSDEDYLRISGKIEQMQEEHGNPGEKTEKILPDQKETAEELIQLLTPVIDDQQVLEKVSGKIREYFGIRDENKDPMLYELLPPENIQLDVSCRGWREAIWTSAMPLLEKNMIEECYIDAMIQNVRENGAYIVISPGFALPHEGFDKGCNRVGMNLIRLTEPVIIEDIDGELEEVKFFCCMSTEDHKKHMKAFFHLVNMLTNARFKEEIEHAKTPEEMAEIFKKYEMRIRK